MKRNLYKFIGILIVILMNICGCGENETDSMDFQEEHQNVQENKAESVDSNTDKLYVIFTVDVEDDKGNEPYLIEGDLTEFGIEENCGINYIMDTFEQYDSRAVFFVNIYEHNLYDSDYMPSLLSRIDERGHEVALHAHNPSDHSLDFYEKGLADYTLEEQKIILSYGRDYIYNAIGKYPVAYRSGAYRINDDTFKALSETGFLIDSSVYYEHENNKLVKIADCKNQVFQVEECIEIPVEVVFNGSGWSKLDINWMTKDELLQTIDMARESSGTYNVIQIMLHSYSFLDLKGEGEALCLDGKKSIFGEDLDTKRKLNSVLKYLNETEGYEIITFEDYVELGLEIPEYIDDNLIYLDNKELAYERKDIEVTTDGRILFMNNKYQGNEIMYAWEIYNADNVEEKYTSGYDLQGSYEVKLPESANGLYYVKAYIKNSDDEKVRGTYYEIVVVDGNIEAINSH